MNAPLASPNGSSLPGPPAVRFSRTADGLLAARIGDVTFAMVPGNRGPYIASAYKPGRPFEQLTRDDFHSHHGDVSDEAGFRNRMDEQAEHTRECKRLRRTVTRLPVGTPWGPSQTATIHAEGVFEHSTASHGGFHLASYRNARVHPMLRTDDGWYEEDCAWSIVAITFPDLFTAYERRCAERTLKDWWPDAWEAIFGTILGPGESHERDRRAFEAEHRDDWIVVSAITSSHQPGFVECVATPGGKRDAATPKRRFLVPSAEYTAGRFGFVIDPGLHPTYDGPSDFVGWRS